MNKILAAAAAACALSLPVQADTPINGGDVDLVINPIGETSVGLRLAASESIAVYGLVYRFDRLTDEESVYLTSSEEYEDYRTEKDPDLSVGAGVQFFVTDGFFLLGEVGYYNSDNTYEYEDDTKEQTTFSGLNGSIGGGFEHAITDRLSLHTSAEVEIGRRDVEDMEFDSNGDQTAGYKTDRSYTLIQYRLGFSYTLF